MFKKKTAPMFKAIAAIGDDGVIEFEFRTVGRKAFSALMKSVGAGEKTEAQALDELIAGWNHEHADSLVTVPYSPDALDALLDEFWSAGGDVVSAYVKGRAEAKKTT